jgi:hypothetical protein
MVAFRQDGSTLDTVTVMLMMSGAQIVIQCHDMIRCKSAEFRGRQAQFMSATSIMSATSKQWTSSQDIRFAMSRAAEIRAGHRQGTDLVILDIEFSQSRQV